jgi:hypothetical protein
MIPPPNPVIDAMARESARNAPRLTDPQKHRLAVLLRPDPSVEKSQQRRAA